MHCQHKPNTIGQGSGNAQTSLQSILRSLHAYYVCELITVSPVLSLKRVIDLRVSYMYRRRAVRERSQSFFAM